MKKVKVYLGILALSLGLYGCGVDEVSQKVMDDISAIGEVDVNDEELINKIDETYNTLTDKQKNQVKNYADFLTAKDRLVEVKEEKTKKLEEEAKKLEEEKEIQNFFADKINSTAVNVYITLKNDTENPDTFEIQEISQSSINAKGKPIVYKIKYSSQINNKDSEETFIIGFVNDLEEFSFYYPENSDEDSIYYTFNDRYFKYCKQLDIALIEKCIQKGYGDELDIEFSVNPEDEYYKSSTAKEDNKSVTEKAYDTAVNLNDKSMLTEGGFGSYQYKGINISEDEVKWMEDGALYRSIAQQLEGFYVLGEKLYGNWGEKTVAVVFGFEKKDTWEEMQTLVDEAMTFISKELAIDDIVKKLESLENVRGEFDYENKEYNFVINDLTKAAAELGITEEMLGYTLASLNEYAPTTAEFNDNTFTFAWQTRN